MLVNTIHFFVVINNLKTPANAVELFAKSRKSFLNFHSVTYIMNIFQKDIGIAFKKFSKAGNKYIKAATGKEMIISPYIYEYFFPFDNLVKM